MCFKNYGRGFCSGGFFLGEFQMSNIDFGIPHGLTAGRSKFSPSITRCPGFAPDIRVRLELSPFQRSIAEADDDKDEGKELDIRPDMVWQKSMF